MRYDRSAPKARPRRPTRWLASATSRASALATIAGSTARCATHEVAPITPQASGGAARTQSAHGLRARPDARYAIARVQLVASSSDRCAAAAARSLRGLEHGDDLSHRRGRDGERLAEVQVVGEIAMEREGLLDRWGQARLAEPVAALVAREQQLGGRLGVVRLGRDVPAARLDVLERHRAVPADQRAGRALHVELGPPDGGDVALEELGLPPVRPRHADAELVVIGDVVPDALVPVRLHDARHPVEELEHPVDVMRSPVVAGAARDRGVRMPRPARMGEAAHEGLDVEHVAEEARSPRRGARPRSRRPTAGSGGR